VEEFLRWSPHVRRERTSTPSPDAGLFDPSPPVAGRTDAGGRRRPGGLAGSELGRSADPGEAFAPSDPSIPDPSRLEPEEVIAALTHLDAAGLDEVERRERSGPARAVVLEAIEGARSYQSG
jgi:hypothetical protein